uniref:Protein kintoun n=1 Tax=Hemiselmis tepida TaxID=464990 RepID=A0A7S0VUV5_9CRYP
MASHDGLNTANLEKCDVDMSKMSKEDRIREAEILSKASAEDLKDMFDHFKSTDKRKELEMTEAEAKRIEECMDKPEFMGLFREYVKDISDPDNMEEYDQYIRQLEEEGEIPEDEEVVRPEKGFCLKTKTHDVNGKVFVNICGTDACPPPSQEAGVAREPGSTGDPGKGTHWSIPYIYTSCRMDQDKEGQPCHVYDILFHLDTIKIAEKDARFRALVTQTALESLEEAGKLKLKDPKTGKYDFKILTNMKYKGKVIRPHKLKKDRKVAPKKEEKKTQAKPQAKKPEKPKQPEDPTKPKVTLVHRGEFEMHSLLQAHGKIGAPVSSRPKQLVARIDLPLMKSAADMDLETRGGYLELEVPGIYSLKQKLPFPVDEASGDAKYNKTLKQLTVTLDVLPWEPEELKEEIARAEAEAEEKRLEEEKRRKEEEAAAELKRKQDEEDAKRAVPKGFLNNGGKKAKQPVAAEEARVGEAASGGEGKGEMKRVLIEEVDEGEGEIEGDAGVPAAPAEKEGGTPPLNFRQNEQNVTMIVRVGGVDASSVGIRYTRSKVVLDFAADGKDGRVRYRHTVHTYGDIEPPHCRHDVSGTNMVVILRKVVADKWATFVGEERPDEAPAPAPAAPPPEKGEGQGEQGQEGGGNGGAKHKDRADEDAKPAEAPSAAPGGKEEEVAAVEEEGAGDDEDFSASKAFRGSRDGFVYKMGERGLGYYRDVYSPPATKAPTEEEDKENIGGAEVRDAAEEAKRAQADGVMDAYKQALPKLGFANHLMFELD